ncbi:MAG: hypothetical protein GY765_21080, partial [bacterium]|nr:hypothetical protein [bacterium]
PVVLFFVDAVNAGSRQKYEADYQDKTTGVTVAKDVHENEKQGEHAVYISRKNEHFQFYFDSRETDIRVHPPLKKYIKELLADNKKVLCILKSHGGAPKKRFMAFIEKQFERYKKVRHKDASAVYYRLKPGTDD